MVQAWRLIQLQNFTAWEKFATYLELDSKDQKIILKNPSFPLNIPLRLACKIKKSTLDDPILKQFLPKVDELIQKPGFFLDPVQDISFRKEESKLLKKYEGRALLLVSSACAMHCRYCFRQNYTYETERKDFSSEIELIRQDSSLKEIILSGGDPLSISDEKLQILLMALNEIPHIKRIRFHTRFPVGIPERIDDSLLSIFKSVSKQIIFILHTNHVRELDEEVLTSMKKIQRLGIPVLSHTVLLKEINDDVKTLQELFETLSDHGILPYYLFQLDKVQGASHFEVLEEEGKKLMEELSSKLSGYALPKYAKEEPGKPAKTPILFT